MANAPGISAFPKTESNLLEWQATINGPPDSVCSHLQRKLTSLALQWSIIPIKPQLPCDLPLYSSPCNFHYPHVPPQHRHVRQHLSRHPQRRMVGCVQRSNYPSKHTIHARRTKSQIPIERSVLSPFPATSSNCVRAAMLWRDNKMEEYKRLVMGRYNLKSD